MGDYFSYDGRYNRQRFIFVWLGFTVVSNFTVFVLYALYPPSPYGVGIAPLLSFSLACLFAALFSPAVVKRLHDLGRPGTHYWLLFIPLFNIFLVVVLLAKSGDRDRNTYGESPLPAAGGGASVASCHSALHRDCPYCAELIRVAAVKCRYCGSSVEPIKSDDDEVGKSNPKIAAVDHALRVKEVRERLTQTHSASGPQLVEDVKFLVSTMEVPLILEVIDVIASRSESVQEMRMSDIEALSACIQALDEDQLERIYEKHLSSHGAFGKWLYKQLKGAKHLPLLAAIKLVGGQDQEMACRAVRLASGRPANCDGLDPNGLHHLSRLIEDRFPVDAPLAIQDEKGHWKCECGKRVKTKYCHACGKDWRGFRSWEGLPEIVVSNLDTIADTLRSME